MSSKRIAIIGAGPIGIEAALYGASLGHDVHVYERGRVGENILQWGYVQLFSQQGINRSSLGARVFEKARLSLPALPALPQDDAYLTGAQYVEAYLRPLSLTAPLVERIHEKVEVVAVSRDRIGKRDFAGGRRGDHPFRLLVNGARGEEIREADVLIDASGTYGHHNWMGSGNVPALGERALEEKVRYAIEDVLGTARDRYAGRRVLVVGTGHSAATALDALTRLEETSVVWISNKERAEPLTVIENDPLPERARLAKLANSLASGARAGVEYRNGTVIDRLEERNGRFTVHLRSSGRVETVGVDRILALVGYSPDNQIYRELQVHECYASLGPMSLSAALLSEDASDCLAQKPKGADVLKNPEPDFYIVGAKSYGKNSNFLIRIGIAQVREIYTLIEGRADLDLYAA